MLARKAVVIVETEIIISLSMQAALQSHGIEDVIIMTSPRDFAARGMSWSDIAFAILELERDRAEAIALIRAAREHDVPVLGLTADSRLEKGMSEFADMPILVKPVPDQTLIEAVSALKLTRSNQNE